MIAFLVWKMWPLQKFQIEKLSKANNLKRIWVTELWFLCTALLRNVIHQCMKVHVDSCYSLDDLGPTKIQSEH